MWETKYFKTKEAMEKWIKKNASKYQYEQVFTNNEKGNNSYALEVKKLRIIDIQ